MAKKTTKLYWGYDHKKQDYIYLTGEEFIKKLQPLVSDPVQSIIELEGDMLMSDYQKLSNAKFRIERAIEMLNKDEDV